MDSKNESSKSKYQFEINNENIKVLRFLTCQHTPKMKQICENNPTNSLSCILASTPYFNVNPKDGNVEIDNIKKFNVGVYGFYIPEKVIESIKVLLGYDIPIKHVGAPMKIWTKVDMSKFKDFDEYWQAVMEHPDSKFKRVLNYLDKHGTVLCDIENCEKLLESDFSSASEKLILFTKEMARNLFVDDLKTFDEHGFVLMKNFTPEIKDNLNDKVLLGVAFGCKNPHEVLPVAIKSKEIADDEYKNVSRGVQVLSKVIASFTFQGCPTDYVNLIFMLMCVDKDFYDEQNVVNTLKKFIKLVEEGNYSKLPILKKYPHASKFEVFNDAEFDDWLVCATLSKISFMMNFKIFYMFQLPDTEFGILLGDKIYHSGDNLFYYRDKDSSNEEAVKRDNMVDKEIQPCQLIELFYPCLSIDSNVNKFIKINAI